MLNEPTAAALAHGIHKNRDQHPFLVFDLGGGTFDVSIVEIFEDIIEVRASAGDNRLGGEDFNDVLVGLVLRRLPTLTTVSSDSRLREIMRATAERCRRTLTTSETAPFDFVWQGQAFKIEVTAAEFEEESSSLIARLRDPVLRSLRDSNIVSDSLSEIVMVGGSTRMPIIRRAVTRMFGRFPDTSIDPDHAVALGAAVQAGLRARGAGLEEIRLTDVCPFSLGVESSTRDQSGRRYFGIFVPIIERNTVIPASRVHHFSTLEDNQKAVNFGVYQGESRTVDSNIKLGEVSIAVPRRPAGRVGIECRFSYDPSGLLEVDVTVPETGITKQLVICDEADASDDAQLASRKAALAALKMHPRVDAANTAVLARAARCYESFLHERRDFIGQLILSFESVLERQDPREVEVARREMEAQLDALEGERFL